VLALLLQRRVVPGGGPFPQRLACMLARAFTFCRIASGRGPFRQHLVNEGEYGAVSALAEGTAGIEPAGEAQRATTAKSEALAP